MPGEAGKVKYRYCVYCAGKFSRWEGTTGELTRLLDLSSQNTQNLSNYIKETADCLDVPVEESINLFAGHKELSSPREKSSSGSGLSSPRVRRAATFRTQQLAEIGHRAQKNNALLSNDGVVIASYFLPIILSKSSSGKWSATWDSENILALTLDARVMWVGSVRYNGAAIPVEEEDAVTKVLAEMHCYPIFINETTHYQFYDVYCKQNLWLLLHQIADVYGPLDHEEIGAKGQQDLWFTYTTVNRIFRDKIVEVYNQGDIVWIHGFHLMLLPTFLRRFLQSAKIGYFFHTPFPSSEIWRTITRREDLLRGILSADHIGFHLYEYARHFLTTCHRVLGYNSEMSAGGTLTVNVDGREVAITCIHVGVDLPRLQVALHQEKFEETMNSWKNKFPNRTIVAGIDRLERLKGIPLKLIAIEQFMDENPKWLGKIVFAIIGISALERGDDYRQTQHDVTVMAERINNKFNDSLVYFEERKDSDCRLFQRLAFFAIADILMITATRDGLNRLPMEFTLARQYAGQFNPTLSPTVGGCPPNEGIVIMSEFISSSRVMRGALTVNPWRVIEVKEALTRALEMKATERSDRMRRNAEFSSRLTTLNWAKHVLHDIKSVEKEIDQSQNFAVGFGMGFRVMGVKASFKPVDVGAMSKAYRNAHSRLLVFDWGGTLVAETDKVDKLQAYAVSQGHASRSGPTTALKELLVNLCSDIRNTVFVVSGKMLFSVQSFFGDIEGLGLGAEHGFYYKWPNEHVEDDNSKSRWHTIHDVGSQEWKQAAKVLMDIYVQRTHGTYIEQKGMALIWQFRDADPEFGFLQSKELEENRRSLMNSYGVEVIRGGGVADGYIEVRPAGVSKGLFIQHALGTLKSLDKEPDFVLAVGDDNSDEPMFEQIAMLKPELATYSVTVGKKPSAAASYVDDVPGVLEMLSTLVRSSQRDPKYLSSIDLSLHSNSLDSGRPLGCRVESDNSLNTHFPKNDNLVQKPISPTSENGFHRTMSNAHLSMTNYLDSIKEPHDDEEEDEGVFF